jgi:methylthioribose-1-phosphate isomerase
LRRATGGFPAALQNRFRSSGEKVYLAFMKIGGIATRSIWLEPDGVSVGIFDQTLLPWRIEKLRLRTAAEAAHAIASMQTRGAPLIGAVAAYGLALALRDDASDSYRAFAYETLLAARPTAINLQWALDQVSDAVRNLPEAERERAAFLRAAAICDEDIAINAAIGSHGLELIEAIAARKPAGEPVNILTHCNAGWLATVDLGTATAPIYMAHDKGVPVHVFVDETRPRNQGAALTAFELGQHGVRHTVIADNAGGHLMQHGKVDIVIVGTDRTTGRGDVCNKIGTYLKALAARDNDVPFYVALPSPTIDFALNDGIVEVPIEQRDASEVATVSGLSGEGRVAAVRVVPEGSPVANPAFDVTPARLVTGLITERGVIAASREALERAFPDHPSRRRPPEAAE